MRKARGLLCLVALVATAGAMPDARAQSPRLRDARQRLDALDYDGALRSLEQTLQAGGGAPAEMTELYRLLGEVNAALGRTTAAEGHFRALLSLDPEVRLPEGSSPKLVKPFEAARGSVYGRLVVRCDGHDDGRVEVYVDADPAGLVAGARAVFRVDGREQTLDARGAGSMTLALPPGAQGEVVCAAMDAHGNRLAERDVLFRSTPALLHDADTTPASDSTPSGRPFYARWYTWAGLTAVAGGAGVYFGLRAQADQDELDRINAASSEHFFSEAEAVEERGRRNALRANIGYGVAGACAVVTAILIVRGDPDQGPRTLAVSPMPADRGTGVSLSFTF